MKEKIIGSKFTLRKLNSIDDKESIINNINDNDILNKLSFEYPYTEGNYEKFCSLFDKEKNDENYADINFVIDIDGKAVGAISLMGTNKKSKSHLFEIGYWLGKKYWGRGIMTEAVKLISDYAFRELNKLKLIISFLEDNVRSKRVAEKNGFVLEYIKRKESFKEGKYKDLIYFTKFNENFKEYL